MTTASPAPLLKRLVDRQGGPQKTVALSWLGLWNATAQRQLSINTVGPRLSNALSDQLDGWQFFFSTPQRAAMLFEVLNATEAERDELARAVAERLAGHRPPRVVVDLHDFVGDDVAILVAVDRAFLSDRTLIPAVVLVTTDQWARLPMAYSDRKDELRLVKVANAEEASDAICLLPGALVASSRPPRDPETGAADFTRWVALEWGGGELQMLPEGAVEAFARDGGLPDLPAVEPAHRLDALGISPQAPTGTATGRALWRRLQAIASGSLDAPADLRLGEALANGIMGASTDDERVRAALAAAGLPPEDVVDGKALAHALARAAARPAPAHVYFCDNCWHLLNATVPVALLAHPRVLQHSAIAGTTPLHRLAAAVAGRTSTDWELDPLLGGVIAALDPAAVEAEAFAHARAWFVHGGHCSVAEDVPVTAPVERLARLLKHSAPPAQLRLTRVESRQTGQSRPNVFVLPDPAVLSRDVWAQFPPTGATVWQRRGEQLAVAWVPEEKKVGDLLHSGRYNGPPKDPFSGPVWEGAAALPVMRPLDDDAWLDALGAKGPAGPAEHLRHRHRVATALDHPERRDRDSSHGFNVVRAALQVSIVAPPDWADLDLAVELAWSALRDALVEHEPREMRDGRWLLAVSPGLLAELSMVAAQETAEIRAGVGRMFECGSDTGRRWPAVLAERPITLEMSPLRHAVDAWRAEAPGIGTIQIGPTVPVALHLVGEGLACAVRFVADPYGLASRPGASRAQVPAGLAAAVGVAVAQAEAERLANDD